MNSALPIDTGNTTWLLISTALVMLMTPALGFFEAGSIKNRNAIAVLVRIFAGLGLLSILWLVIGFSLAFGQSGNSIIGNLDQSFFNDIPVYQPVKSAPTVPGVMYGAFEMMFAVVTPLLISGSFAARIKPSAFIVFIIAWSFLVYYPLAHWVWGKGWLQNLGVYDFAGGIVVHTSAGMSALAAALVLARKREPKDKVATPSNISLSVVGAALLWLGWFGFNAGSALVSGTMSPSQYEGLASNTLLTTQIASSASALVWIFHSWHKPSKGIAMSAINGAVAGLAGVTPASGFITLPAALVLGIILGFVSYYVKQLFSERWKINDALDVSSIHGSTGIVGSLAVGFIATAIINPIGPNGLLYGNPSQLGVQGVGVLSAAALAFGATAFIVKLIDKTIGLEEKEEPTEKEGAMEEQGRAERERRKDTEYRTEA
jgi:Amt family ammonium transporter